MRRLLNIIILVLGIVLVGAMVLDIREDFRSWTLSGEIHRNLIWGIVLPAFSLLFSLVFLGRTFRRKYSKRKQNVSNLKAPKDKIIERFINLLKIPPREVIAPLACVMFVVWNFGWLFYYIAIIIDTTHPHGIGDAWLYSAVSSLDMFFMDINGNVMDLCQSRSLKYAISLLTILATLTMVALLVSLFISRLYSHLHVKHLTKSSFSEVYVFFGVNEPSQKLAESIRQKKGEEEKYIIVFVEEAKINEDDTDGWQNVVAAFTHRKRNFVSVNQDEHDALVVSSQPIQGKLAADENIWEQLNLQETLGAILRKSAENPCSKHHFFFLSEDRDANVASTINLSNNVAICHTSISTVIYCQTRHGGLSRMIEHTLPHSGNPNIEVKVLDNSQLSIDEIKCHIENQPIKFVDIDTSTNPGTVTSPFTSLIIGFGETGQDMCKFLYEFGAFVDSLSTADFTFRSPFRCHVVDANLDEIKGKFIAETPGIPTLSNSRDNLEQPLISYHPCDYRSHEFYNDILIPIAQELNYVVVALGNDETNMSVATDILKLVRRYRKDLSKFCIFVRLYVAQNYMQIDEIASYYNKLTGNQNIIRPFGRTEDLFTYDLIISEVRTEKAKTYYDQYNLIADKLYNCGPSKPWDIRHKDIRSTNWIKISKARNQEAQDYSNVDHGNTKLHIIEQCMRAYLQQNGEEPMEAAAIINSFADIVFNRDTNGSESADYRTGGIYENDTVAPIVYKNLQQHPYLQQLMENLAKHEHLRWNARQETLGFVPDQPVEEIPSSADDPLIYPENADKKQKAEIKGQWKDKCRYQRKRHPSLAHWNDLDPSVFVYDYIVTETTLKLYRSSNKNEEESEGASQPASMAYAETM